MLRLAVLAVVMGVTTGVMAQGGSAAAGVNQRAGVGGNPGTLSGVDSVAQGAAVRIVEVVEADLAKHGAERVIQEMSNPRGAYVNGDTLAFLVDRTTNFMLAHPIHGAEAVGKKVLQQIHDSDNRAFGKELVEQLNRQGWGYVRIRYPSAVSRRLILKSIVCKPDRSAKFIICGSSEERPS